MNLGEKNSTIKNKVFDGAYSIYIAPVDPELESFWYSTGINPSGMTGILVKYSSGNKNIESGFFPTGLSPKIDYQSGASSIGDLSGYLYYRMSTPIFGTCHGFGNDKNTWFSGYNFYNAFHPEGYISPPFGQIFSTYKDGSFGVGALQLNGSCSSLTSQEYNDLFGIVSQTDDGITASAEGLEPQSDSFVNSPAIACPQDLSIAYYWREKQYKIIAGTAGAITANLFFNNNPIPIPLDMFNIKTSFRYESSGEELDDYYEDGEGRLIKKKKYTVKYSEGKPVAKYLNLTTKGSNPLLNKTCFGSVAEGKLIENYTLGSTQITSLLIDSPDVLGQPAKSKFDFFAWWNTWHFLFKENSDGFPFQNDYKSYSTEGGDYLGLSKTPSTSNYGSQIFKAELSNPDHYWENRQCPGIVDFLPHTFGASIYACPSYHFDVPYYAALNKFGFYGARFLNGCVSLYLDYPSSGYNPQSNPPSGAPNALELPGEGYSYIYPEESEPDEDVGTIYGNSIYDNLLDVAKKEESHNDFFALNKLLFLWTNYDIITGSAEFKYLVSGYPSISGLVSGSINDFNILFPNGKSGLLVNNSWFQQANMFFDTGNINSLLRKNDSYKEFLISLSKLILPEDTSYWTLIEKEYLNSVLSESGIVNTGFYDLFEKYKINRLQSRYLENFIKGNPIDLYPSNKITFGFDSAKKFIDSPSWGKATGFFGLNLKFEDSGLDRRYFIGAYAEALDFVGYSDYIKSINSQINNNLFYPGYFNSIFGKDFPDQNYSPVVLGNAFSGESVNKNTITGKQNLLPQGWFALGYGGVVKLNGSYSCFTPIFIQQPISLVHCKIGQSPTFRCLAVDYHTIPEDKINDRYPEIMYWTKKLKIIDSKYKNKYPLSYKWFRIPKSGCNYNFENFIASGYFANTGVSDYFHNPTGFPPLEPSNSSGAWCCLEGDGPNCTLIHPKECEPIFSQNNLWSYKYEGNPGFEEAKRNNFYMKFKKGAIKNKDDDYFYFCMVKGRFGIRISEPSELFVDDNLRFDISVQNAGNTKISPKISFDFGASGKFEIGSIEIPSYGGLYKDEGYIPENVIQQKMPPPNRGFGDVYSYKFVGTWGYGGALQSYTPGTLDDTRGLKETWGRFLHYGSLIKYEKKLSQQQGDLIYGVSHLPTCVSGLIKDNKEGIFLNIDVNTNLGQGKILHWANMQTPVASTSQKAGVLWNKLGNAGELYNPVSYYRNGEIDYSPTPGLGQWQWGNNLGTIHKFGYTSPNSELKTYPGSLTDGQINELKEKLLKNSLDGPDCGWNDYGLGRNMLYWIEGFSSFYVFCDPIKKKSVPNYNYMGPSLRHTNSSIQYFWLGKPSNTYLKRYPMAGPYAYQWKVMPHNRDRNGNGMSEGFYSYGWGTNYSLMYDAPAIYGLFRQYGELSQAQQDELNQINNLRIQVFGRTGQRAVRYNTFGFTYGDGGAVQYGRTWIGNITEPGDITKPEGIVRNYVQSGEYLAKYPKFELYGCDDSDLKNGDCFDACISIRYPFGFMPGGKIQKLTTIMPSGYGYNLVANNIFSGSSYEDKTTYLSGVFFRGPFGTPHHLYLKSIGSGVNGISPCSDGGADHCNYITPTINLGASSYLSTRIPTMISAINQANSIVNYRLPPGI